MMEEGDMANPGMPILEVENTDKIKIIAKVPENEIHKLSEGLPVKIQVRASNVGTNGSVAEGAILRIVPSADPMSRQFDIHVVVDNQDNRIRSGMFARIHVAGTGRETIVVPAGAVFKRGQLEGVYVIKPDNKVSLRWIRTGIQLGSEVEILSGLNPDELVVTEGIESLTDGQKVEVK
jgi:RND family efflux transporter MFP subunit